jgi:hypothetical protein
MADNLSLALLLKDRVAREAKIAELEAKIHSPQGDTSRRVVDTKVMNDITRDELNAKLEALESRMDSRVSTIGGKIDAFLAAQAERDKASEYRFGRVESDLSSIKTDVKTMSSEVHEVRRTLSKYTGGIAVAAAIAGIMLGAIITAVARHAA